MELIHAFDTLFLGCAHWLQINAEALFTPLSWGLGYFGKGGMGLIALGLILSLYKPTRKVGITMLVALAIGALITNVTLKNLMFRPRPFMADATYREWWAAVGSWDEGASSFPSGHATATTAALVAWAANVRTHRPAAIAVAGVGVLLMMASRCYLMVHYPSDVVAGLAVGLFAAFVATRLVGWGAKKLQARRSAAT